MLEELKAVSLESQRCEMERPGDPGGPGRKSRNHGVSLGNHWGLKDRFIHDRIFDLAYRFAITCICTYISFVLYIHVYTYIYIYTLHTWNSG